MKCPECDTWTIVKDTRLRSDGSRLRRYECANEHRFSTVERVEAQRVGRVPSIDIKVAAAMLREGEKLIAVALEFGVTESAVHTAMKRAGLPTSAKAYRKEMK